MATKFKSKSPHKSKSRRPRKFKSRRPRKSKSRPHKSKSKSRRPHKSKSPRKSKSRKSRFGSTPQSSRTTVQQYAVQKYAKNNPDGTFSGFIKARGTGVTSPRDYFVGTGGQIPSSSTPQGRLFTEADKIYNTAVALVGRAEGHQNIAAANAAVTAAARAFDAVTASIGAPSSAQTTANKAVERARITLAALQGATAATLAKAAIASIGGRGTSAILGAAYAARAAAMATAKEYGLGDTAVDAMGQQAFEAVAGIHAGDSMYSVDRYVHRHPLPPRPGNANAVGYPSPLAAAIAGRYTAAVDNYNVNRDRATAAWAAVVNTSDTSRRKAAYAAAIAAQKALDNSTEQVFATGDKFKSVAALLNT